MTKRTATALLVLLMLTRTGWSKIKKDEQEYFDTQFQLLKAQIAALQDQNKALTGQLTALGAQMTQLQKAQVEAAELIHRDGGFLEEVNQSLRMNQMTHEQDYNTMKQILGLLQSERDQLSTAVSGNGAAAAAPTVVVVPQATTSQPAPSQSAPAPATVLAAAAPRIYYIIVVEGDKYTLGLGSAQGAQVGTKLAVYKKSSPSERIGQLEVTDVIDDNDCHARLATLNPGVRIEPNDIVQLQ